MNTDTTKSRNWPLTLLCIPPLLLFLYIGIGVWFVKPAEPVYAEVYVKSVLSLICGLGVFIFGRIIWRGYTNKRLSDILSDIVSSI